MRIWTCVVSLALAACTAGERRLDPAELEARDLLGVSSQVAAGWDAGERQSARAVLRRAWEEGGAAEMVALPDGGAGDAEAAREALAALDARREAAGEPPIIAGAAPAEATGARIARAPIAAIAGAEATGPERAAGAPAIVAVDWWPEEVALVERGGPLLAAIARAGGHPAGEEVVVRPAHGQPYGAIYLGRSIGVLVNPVLLASIDPAPAGEAAPVPVAVAGAASEPAARPGGGRPGAIGARPQAASAGGNPYSFFGSVAECAAFHRLRCEDCLPGGTCEQTSRGAADGNAECEALAAGDGRGYYLYCVNLSLAIATVAECAADEAPGCAQDTGASNQIGELEDNAIFIDDPSCLAGLDACLGEIYGEPEDDFPQPGADAGPDPPPPPRDTDTSCSGSDTTCDFSPQCDADCSSSCDDVFSCDADCNGSGSSGGCDSCGGGGDSGTSGGGGCGGDDGCGGCDDGCGGSGGGGGGGGGSGGGGCDGGGGDCGGSGCGGSGDCGGDCGSGGSGSGCVVSGAARAQAQAGSARPCRRRGGSAAGLVALVWAIVPLPYLERCRRRARRRQRQRADQGGEP